MGFKSVLGKIGKIALTAAPYVAAPFTGGASLMATGLANEAVNKWSQHDAKNAIAKGLAPSSFDRILGKVGTISNIASSVVPTGALGKIGMLGKAAKIAKTADTAKKVGTAAKVAGVLKNAQKISNVAAPIMSTIQSNPEVNPGIGPSTIPDYPTMAPPPVYNTADAIARGRQKARAY